MFQLEPGDSEKINKWLKETVYPPIVAEQRENPDIAHFLFESSDGTVYPYEGAIGGGLTYSFTPTSLGTIVKVQHSSGAVLDLTDYNW